ncbi:glycosyltransferase [Salinicoccus siamensis]|uniref:Glycosyltransferase n=1 Tax=Salinicoccus siamensis TaxID=381830 RepID=A0ABV5Z615_9STAP
MEKLISIVVPVYNKAKYLHQCLDSLINLDIDKETLEVICVDDLSSDGSLEIMNDYSREYDFIKVIPLEENSGSPSRPRNIGFEEAKGKYLALLDADDWLDSKGFPKLLLQMEENGADIGFGQSYKHTNKNITKLGAFTSYKKENQLVPYEIDKIFRAVGPPGKIFKRSIVIDNNIKFEHMAFGEDKLFFTELISKCENASMTNEAVYHVNRHAENVSLVRGTSILEKAAINLTLLRKIMKLEIPQSAKKSILSRMVEVDFMRRFFHTKTFLASLEKDKYYKIFGEVVQTFSENGLNIEDYIEIDKFKNIYRLFNTNKANLEEYLEYLVVEGHKSFYVENGVVHQRFPSKFSGLNDVTAECFAVYGGTHYLNGDFYEIIHFYKEPQVDINGVYMSKISDESKQQSIKYKIEDNKIYIRTNDLKFNEDAGINLRIAYDGFKSILVNSSLPNASETYQQKRQNFKVEFKQRSEKSLLPADSYISVLPQYIVAVKDINTYLDEDFKNISPKRFKAGTRISIDDTVKSQRGTPRLKTKEGYIISANKKLVKELTDDLIGGYVFEVPKEVKIIRKCKLYESVSFKTDPLRTLEPGEIMKVNDIVYTKKLTPRLVVGENIYMTANLDYVEAIY